MSIFQTFKMKQMIFLLVPIFLSSQVLAAPAISPNPRSSKAILTPTPSPTQTSPPELKYKRQDTTIVYSNDPTDTDTLLPVITSSAADTTITWTSATDSPVSTWNGGTTIENTGTLTFGGQTQTLTFGGQTITVTFPGASAPTPNDSGEEIEQRQFLPGSWTTESSLPVETSWSNGDPGLTLTFGAEAASSTPEVVIEERELLPFPRTGAWTTQSILPVVTSWYNGPSRPGGSWTTDSVLPVVTSWLNGGPGFSLTFGAEAAAATGNIIEVEKRQITWDTTLPVTTYWGDQTITIGGETITFGSGPEMSLTIEPDEAMITARPTLSEKDLAKRQVGVIVTGGPWTEDNGATFTDYWGLPGQVVTLLGPNGDETLTLSGTPRDITPPGAAQAKTTQR